MITIMPEKLKNQINKKIYPYYILLGNEPFQIYESINTIKLAIKKKDY